MGQVECEKLQIPKRERVREGGQRKVSCWWSWGSSCWWWWGSRARDGTGCYWAQKRKGQALSRKNQRKRLKTQPDVQRVWVKSFTREDTLYRQMQSHQNSDWKRIKSENMRRSLIKRAKPLLVAQIIFSFFPLSHLFIPPPLGRCDQHHLLKQSCLNFRSTGFVKQSTLDFHRFGNCLGESVVADWS